MYVQTRQAAGGTVSDTMTYLGYGAIGMAFLLAYMVLVPGRK